MAIELGSIVWIGAVVGMVAAAYGVLRVVAAGTAGAAAPDRKDLVATPMPKLPLLARPWIAVPLISLAGLAIVAIGNRPQSNASEKTETKPLKPVIEMSPKSDLEKPVISAESGGKQTETDRLVRDAIVVHQLLNSGIILAPSKNAPNSLPAVAPADAQK